MFKFQRTNATNLTDDELILFDAMFYGSVSLKQLRRQNEFEARFNFPYNHQLSDVELERTIVRLEERNLLRHEETEHSKTDEKYNVYTLTPKGGRYWELEREPDWTQYYLDSWYTPDDDAIVQSNRGKSVGKFSIQSPRLAVVETYMSEIFPLMEDELWSEQTEITLLHDVCLVPWKCFLDVYELTGYSRLSNRTPNWKLVEEKKRRMWNGVNDLLFRWGT